MDSYVQMSVDELLMRLSVVTADIILAQQAYEISESDRLREWDRAYSDCAEETHAARSRFADHHALLIRVSSLEHESNLICLREERDLLRTILEMRRSRLSVLERHHA